MDELIGLFGVSEEDGGDRGWDGGDLMDYSDRHQMQPEIEEGNIEFKLKLTNPSESRMEHLVSQMKWRLREGNGEAIYEIGVEDDGAMMGLTEDDLRSSLENLNKMASRLQADTTILREVVVDVASNRRAVEVLVRKIPSDKSFIDLRICVLGNMDAGKSTLVGVLTNPCELDNGHGRARLNLFRHLHEMQTGHTSSVCHDILGFDSQGMSVDYSTVRNKEEICEASSKLLTLIDLPGGQKGLKTTIFGLTGYYPDVAFITIAANQGIVDSTREHFGLALALNIPCVVLITKSDLLNGHTIQVERKVKRLLQMPGVDKIAYVVNSPEDAQQAASKLSTDCVTPVFSVSCVTGQGIDLLKIFLNLVPCRLSQKEMDKLSRMDPEFKIDETYSVPQVGCVVGGVLHRGIIKRDDKMLLGPYEDGAFEEVRVKSLHRSRAPCSLVKTSECAAIAIDGQHTVRKGMVLVSPASRGAAQAAMELECELLVLHHPTRIQKGFQCTLHIDNIVQTAVITRIELEQPPLSPSQVLSTTPTRGGATLGLGTNEKGKVTFRFVKHCEYIRAGMRLLFREGRSKGIGHITHVTPYKKISTNGDASGFSANQAN